METDRILVSTSSAGSSGRAHDHDDDTAAAGYGVALVRTLSSRERAARLAAEAVERDARHTEEAVVAELAAVVIACGELASSSSSSSSASAFHPPYALPS